MHTPTTATDNLNTDTGPPADPPVDAAFAIAAISMTLPESTSAGRKAFAAITAIHTAEMMWSAETRYAHLRRVTDWLALAHYLGRSIPRLQNLAATTLLAQLRCQAQSASEKNRSA